MATNLTRATATYLSGINPGAWSYVSGVDNSAYNDNTADGSGRPAQFRQAWWRYIPSASGTAGMQALTNTSGGQGSEQRVIAYDGSTYSLALVMTNASGVQTFPVTGGVSYFIVIGVAADVSGTYGFGLFGPNSAPEPVVTADTSNHQYANAITVMPSTNAYYTHVQDNTPAIFGTPETTPPGIGLGGQRAGWYKFTAPRNGSITVNAAASSDNCEIDVLSYTASTWTLLNYVFSSTTPGLSQAVSAGILYYVRIANASSVGQTINVVMTGSGLPDAPQPDIVNWTPITAGATLRAVRSWQPRLPVPAIVARVRLAARITGEIDTVIVNPIRLAVSTPNAVEVEQLRPARVGVTLRLPMIVEAALTLTQPDDGEVVATHRPEFIVGLDQRDESISYTIEIQYDDDADFSSPITLSRTVGGTTGGLFLVPDSDVPNAAFWRARLLLNGVEQITWSAPNAFTVSAGAAASSLPVSWRVSASAEREIHLWHTDPPGPSVGDTVTAYGQGFPLSTGSLLLGDDTVPVLSWDLVAADPANAGVIDGPVIGPEHFAVTFVAPEIEPPGGPLTVEA
jgi:hypothetical protein